MTGERIAARTFQKALITGASSGIGAAFARALPDSTDLVLTGRSRHRLDDLAATLVRPDRSVEVLPADLVTPEGLAAVIDLVRQPGLDLLVCNAGSAVAGDFHLAALEGERASIGLNVIAVMELLHEAIAPMIARARARERRAGVIVVSSRAAFGPSPGMASYTAAKAFQLRLAESMALELESEPIDVLVTCPTYTETAFFARAGMSEPEWWVPAQSVAEEALEALGSRKVVIGKGPHESSRPPLAYRALRRIWRAAKARMERTP